MISKSAVGGKDGALQGGEAPHCLLQQRGASRPSDAIGKGGAAQSGGAADEDKDSIRHAMPGANQSGKGKYDLAGDRKTGIFQKDQKKHGRQAIVCYDHFNIGHKIITLLGIIYALPCGSILDKGFHSWYYEIVCKF